jgi:hypothetical protein
MRRFLSATSLGLPSEPEDLVGADEEGFAERVAGVADVGRTGEGLLLVVLAPLPGGQTARDLAAGSSPRQLARGAGGCQDLREPAEFLGRDEEGVMSLPTQNRRLGLGPRPRRGTWGSVSGSDRCPLRRAGRGARLGSVLGATPHEFESRILRTRPPGLMRAWGSHGELDYRARRNVGGRACTRSQKLTLGDKSCRDLQSSTPRPFGAPARWRVDFPGVAQLSPSFRSMRRAS